MQQRGSPTESIKKYVFMIEDNNMKILLYKKYIIANIINRKELC